VREPYDRGKLILVVEDDEDNRALVEFLINRSYLDVELMMAENGEEAVQCVRKKKPDLILMGMQMPIMDGDTAVPIIKADPELSSISIIAFTALARPEDIARTKSIGCIEHYTKPMDPEQLIKLIQKYIRL
jgi:two-component system, sensor histidine kinase and response regulator